MISITELANKIRETGRLDYPIVITQNNRIISGHRRWQAVKSLGWITVPIERRTYANDIEELEALLIANAYRDKTNAQRGNEYQAWLEIYKAKGEAEKRAQGDKGGEGGRKSKLPAITDHTYESVNTVTTLEPNLAQGLHPNNNIISDNACNDILSEDLTSTKKKEKEKNKPREIQSRDLAASDAGLNRTTAEKIIKVNAKIKVMRDTDLTLEADDPLDIHPLSPLLYNGPH